MSRVVSTPHVVALDDGRHLLDDELAAAQVGALGEHPPAELQGVGDDLAEVPDPDRTRGHGPPVGMLGDRGRDGLTQRHLVHERRPPSPVRPYRHHATVPQPGSPLPVPAVRPVAGRVGPGQLEPHRLAPPAGW